MPVGRPGPARGPGPDVGSDAVAAELLGWVSELTLVLHKVTVQAHELVGLLRHWPDGQCLHPLIGGEVEECFLQCAKAVIRSKLWDTRTTDRASSLPGLAEMLNDQARIEEQSVGSLSRLLEDSPRRQPAGPIGQQGSSSC